MPRRPRFGTTWVARPLAVAAMICLAAVTGCSRKNSSSQQHLAIAAAASVRPAMEALIAQYRQSHPDTTVEATYGASGTLYAQIVNRAPFDLFYSADTSYPKRLADEKLALRDSTRVYAVGRLALILRRDTDLDASLDGAAALKSPAVRHVAIANPELAPYGRAARAALKALNIDAEVAPKLVVGENAEQALHFFQSGAAEAAFVPRGMASLQAIEEIATYWIPPPEIAPPVEHAMVLLAATKSPGAAGRFDAFVAGAEGRRILAEHGLAARE